MPDIDYEALIDQRGANRNDVDLRKQFRRFEEIATNLESLRKITESEAPEGDEPATLRPPAIPKDTAISSRDDESRERNIE